MLENRLSIMERLAYNSDIKNTKKVFLSNCVKKVNLGMLERKEVQIKVFTIRQDLELEDYYSRGMSIPIIYSKGNVLPTGIFFSLNYKEDIDANRFFIDDCEEGEKLIEPPNNPTRDGYNFLGWYKEPDCINLWDFDNEAKGENNLILYAKWIKK